MALFESLGEATDRATGSSHGFQSLLGRSEIIQPEARSLPAYIHKALIRLLRENKSLLVTLTVSLAIPLEYILGRVWFNEA